MTAPFAQIEVTPQSRTARRISWTISADVELMPGYGVRIWRRRAGGDWIEYTEAPLTGVSWAVDADAAMAGLRNDREYLLGLAPDPASPDDVAYSEVVPGTGWFTADGWRVADDILRREQESAAATNEARDGLLYARRTYGGLCATCGDALTGSASPAGCPECLGTGVSGGYFPGWSARMRPLGRSAKAESFSPELGDVSAMTAFFGCTAMPRLHPGDLWQDSGTGDMYEIMSLSTGAVVDAQPVLYKAVAAERLPYGDRRYDILGDGVVYDGEDLVAGGGGAVYFKWAAKEW